ncbi:hypothetical protein C5167_046632 [Papaver somniferum]|uniref:GST N-terminal domain-containing protein n=1 Tax=Papaver somniferum TaxID=3469 RepID=A0A4Y7LF44_PAPSO|nr:hypothetical protein C5167_046632 [Papaver somniferum]
MAALNGNCYSISHGNVDKPFLLFSNNYSTSIRIPQKNTKSSSLSILFSPSLCLCRRSDKTRVTTAFASMATTTSNVQVEELPPALDSTSEPPSVFDGTTRLYISYMCPYAQRVWITRNCKDPAKREFAEELLSYTSEFSSGVVGSIKGDKDVGAPFDYLEAALSKFPDGPFFLGEFSLPLVLDVKKYDFTSGRPKLASWIEELNKIDGYRQTKRDPAELVASLKKRILGI